MSPQEWGHTDNYYAEAPQDAALLERASSVADRWRQLLESQIPDLVERVEATVRDWNQGIRDQLRAETALRLSWRGQHVNVPVRVKDGIPPPLVELIDIPPEILRLVLMRAVIARSIPGVEFTRAHHDDIIRFMRSVRPDWLAPATADELAHVEQLLVELSAELHKITLEREIWRLPVDWLGAYFFRRPSVEIYWIPIGIAATLYNIDVEALTYVVLAHELAHAYTHVGRDIDGNAWDTEHFARTDVFIVEGLAHYYTQALCEKVRPRFPAAERSFRAMLKEQTPGPYADFVKWTENVRDPGEHMRRCMLEVRKKGVGDYMRFQEIVRELNV